MSKMQEPPTPDEAIDSRPPLDDEALARLDEALSPERLGEDAPDVITAHGFLIALAVAPNPVPAERWIPELFDGEPSFDSDTERDEVFALLETLRANAGTILERGSWVELPFDTELDDEGDTASAIEDWCAGFMLGVFLDESAWFAQDEAHVAALLLPFMALSGLFDDQPEMNDMVVDDRQFTTLAAQLPELTLDLYLHFRVPPEPPKKPAGSATRRQARGSKRGKR